MPYLVLVVSLPDLALNTVKDNVNFPTKHDEILQGAINIISGLKGGEKRSDNAYCVVRDTDPSVATHGSGSVSLNCSKP